MAKDKITEYDATADNNTVVGDVNLAENSMNPSDVNNALRELMSHQKEGLGSGTPLYVDQTNNRVGVGTASPSQSLEVAGNIFVNTSGNPNLTVKTSGAGNNPTIRIQADTNYWDLQTLFSNSTDDLDFQYNGTSTMKIDNAGHITKPLQPAFQARPTSTITNIATETVIAMSDEIFDQNSDYNTSTYTFTAPVTGKYQFNVAVRIDSVDHDSNWQRITLDTSNHTYANSIIDLDGLSADPVHWGIAYSVLADMDAGDTALIRWWQSGGSTQADISPSSFFSGYLVA